MAMVRIKAQIVMPKIDKAIEILGKKVNIEDTKSPKDGMIWIFDSNLCMTFSVNSKLNTWEISQIHKDLKDNSDKEWDKPQVLVQTTL